MRETVNKKLVGEASALRSESAARKPEPIHAIAAPRQAAPSPPVTPRRPQNLLPYVQRVQQWAAGEAHGEAGDASIRIGDANGVHEREADAVARRVTGVAPGPGRPGGRPPGAPNANESLATALSRGRGGGRPLGRDVRASMEQGIGADFSGVRVHTDAAADRLATRLRARAFTQAQDVYFRGGEFSTATPDGRSLLAHELTHVAQQTPGVVRRCAAEGDVAAPIRLSPDHGGATIQRKLMALDEFQAASAAVRKARVLDAIHYIDKALTAYNASAVTRENLGDKSIELSLVEWRCAEYLARDDLNSQRRKGVEGLRSQVEAEQSVVDELLAAKLEQAPGVKLQRLFRAQDRQVRAIDQGKLAGPVLEIDRWIGNEVSALRQQQGVVDEVIDGDVRALLDAHVDADTPELTSKILGEVLGNLGIVKRRQARRINPNADFVDHSDPEKGYVVDHKLDARYGSPDRLASLTHELTHVSVAESFGNGFFMFGRGATDEMILGLSTKRSDQIRSLQAALAGDKIRDQPRFSANQRALLQEKLAYPLNGSKFRGNIHEFKTQGLIDADELERFDALYERGANNTLLEFDTVINQMVMLLHFWGTPERSPFRQALHEIAREAYDYRAAARANPAEAAALLEDRAATLVSATVNTTEFGYGTQWGHNMDFEAVIDVPSFLTSVHGSGDDYADFTPGKVFSIYGVKMEYWEHIDLEYIFVAGENEAEGDIDARKLRGEGHEDKPFNDIYAMQPDALTFNKPTASGAMPWNTAVAKAAGGALGMGRYTIGFEDSPSINGPTERQHKRRILRFRVIFSDSHGNREEIRATQILGSANKQLVERSYADTTGTSIGGPAAARETEDMDAMLNADHDGAVLRALAALDLQILTGEALDFDNSEMLQYARAWNLAKHPDHPQVDRVDPADLGAAVPAARSMFELNYKYITRGDGAGVQMAGKFGLPTLRRGQTYKEHAVDGDAKVVALVEGGKLVRAYYTDGEVTNDTISVGTDRFNLNLRKFSLITEASILASRMVG